VRRLVVVVLVAAAFPATAAAHGRSAPVATNWRAEVEHAPRGVLARPVDGDLDLWLQVPRGTTVEISGTLGEPMLRFAPNGTWVNRASPTALGDRILRSAGRGWHRVSATSTYRWHEHRLHVLQVVGGGHWSVPLRVDGRPESVAGVLRRVPPGTPWPWLGIALVVAAVGAWWVGGVRVFGAVALAAAGAVRIGRALYGRPAVPWSGYLDVALTSAFAAALLAGFAITRDAGMRGLLGAVAGGFAFAEAVALWPVLTHGLALNALSTTVSKALVTAALGAGVGAALVGVRLLAREEVPT
jgi:hypothetical protein